MSVEESIGGRTARTWLGVIAAIGVALGCSAATRAGEPQLRGINLSGAELNVARLPGRLNFDYVYPADSELDHAAALGMTVVRLPVLWERLQPRLGAPLDGLELGRLRATVAAARVRHLEAIVDVHDYGTYRGGKIGSAEVPVREYAAFWGRLAAALASDRNVVLGLMNEPNGLAAEDWAVAAQAALDAVRASGFLCLVLVPGTGWDGAHNFVSGAGYGTPNAAVLGRIRDPAGAMAIEVHQYLDADASGTHPDCPAAERSGALLEPFTAWLRANGRRGFLGEFGASRDPQCLKALAAVLRHMDANADVWLGWTYWAGGPWWSPDYMFSVEPAVGGGERPQMEVLRAFFGKPESPRWQR